MPDGFEVGDGVCLRTRNPHNGGQRCAETRPGGPLGKPLQARPGVTRKPLALGESTCTSVFPLLSGEEIENLAIENLTLDGNQANNENLDGNYGGCIFLQD